MNSVKSRHVNQTLHWEGSPPTLLWHEVKALWYSIERQVEQSPVVQLSPTLRMCSVSSVVWTLQACRKSIMSPTSLTTVPLGSFRSSSGFPSQQPGTTERKFSGVCVMLNSIRQSITTSKLLADEVDDQSNVLVENSWLLIASECF